MAKADVWNAITTSQARICSAWEVEKVAEIANSGAGAPNSSASALKSLSSSTHHPSSAHGMGGGTAIPPGNTGAFGVKSGPVPHMAAQQQTTPMVMTGAMFGAQ